MKFPIIKNSFSHKAIQQMWRSWHTNAVKENMFIAKRQAKIQLSKWLVIIQLNAWPTQPQSCCGGLLEHFIFPAPIEGFVPKMNVYLSIYLDEFNITLWCMFPMTRDSQMREIATMRTRVVELESEADRLRRQLTNEKFERSVTTNVTIWDFVIIL